MKYKRLYIIAILALVFIAFGYFYSTYKNQKIKNSPQKYCYETYFGPPNPVLIITDLEFKDSLIAYYTKMEKGENPAFNFPLKTLPQYEPVYVVGYTPDSLLAEVVSFYDRGRIGGGAYLSGYVYIKTLHDTPPSK